MHAQGEGAVFVLPLSRDFLNDNACFLKLETMSKDV